MAEISTLLLAHTSDAHAIGEMSRDFVEDGLTWAWTPARVRHCICDSDSSVVVARRSRAGISGDVGDIMGAARLTAFAIMHFGDDVAHLNLLAVTPDCRRQGLGRRLLSWLMATAVEAGIFRIDLELRVRNEGARRFYLGLGFEELGIVNGYYQGREAARRMSRRLLNNPR